MKDLIEDVVEDQLKTANNGNPNYYVKPNNNVKFNDTDISSLTQSSITRISSQTINVDRTGRRELCEKSDFDEAEFENVLRLNYSEVESDSSSGISSFGKGGREPLLQ